MPGDGPSLLQYATHNAPPALRQINATMKRAVNLILRAYVFTKKIMTPDRIQKCDVSHRPMGNLP